MKQNTKDWIQYTSAMALIASAIALAFISFFLTLDIGAGPLTYIGEALSAALGLFGISVYVVNRFGQFQKEVRRELLQMKEEEKKTFINNNPEHHDEERDSCGPGYGAPHASAGEGEQ